MRTEGIPKKKRKGNRRFMAVIAAIAITAAAFSLPFVFTADETNDQVLGAANVHITGRTVGEIETDIQDAVDSSGVFGTVRVEGRVTGADETLTLNIHNNVTLIWGATYEASCSGPALVLDIDSGRFEVSSRGSLTLTGSGTALELKGSDAELYVSGGIMTVNGRTDSTSAYADIRVTDNGRMTLNGGVTSTEYISIDAGTGGTMEVKGDTIVRFGSVFAYHGGTVTVNGDLKADYSFFIACNSGGTLTVNGSIKATDDTIGYVGIICSSVLTINGSIEAAGTDNTVMIGSQDGGTLTVNGSISAVNSGSAVLIGSHYGAAVTINGELAAEFGLITSSKGSKVAVNGSSVFTGLSDIRTEEGSTLTVSGSIAIGGANSIVTAMNSSTLTVGGDLTFTGDDSRVTAYDGSKLNIKGNVTADVPGQWLLTAGNAVMVIDGSVKTLGYGADVYDGGTVVIKKELIANPDNYISVDGTVLTEDGFSSENTGPYGGREYTVGSVTVPSFVYTEAGGEDECSEADEGPVNGGRNEQIPIGGLIILTLAVLLMIYIFTRERRT